MPKFGSFVMNVYREESQSQRNLTQALCEASLEFLPIALDMEGVRDGKPYRYASLSSIRRSTSAAMAKHGLWLNHVYGQTDRGEHLVSVLRHVSGEYQSSTQLVPLRENMQDQEGVKTSLIKTATKGLLSIIIEEESQSQSSSDSGNANRAQWDSNLKMALKAIADAKSESELQRYADTVAQRVKEGLLSPDAIGVATAKVLERSMELKKEKTSANSAGTAGDQGPNAARSGGGASDRGVGKPAGTGRADVRAGEQRAAVTAG